MFVFLFQSQIILHDLFLKHKFVYLSTIFTAYNYVEIKIMNIGDQFHPSLRVSQEQFLVATINQKTSDRRLCLQSWYCEIGCVLRLNQAARQLSLFLNKFYRRSRLESLFRPTVTSSKHTPLFNLGFFDRTSSREIQTNLFIKILKSIPKPHFKHIYGFYKHKTSF